jgi:UDP-GlcNAc:undecaprenyl-phosphate GlcNAc-1-phosphate transferase
MVQYLILAVLLFAIELIYFRIAIQFNIIDKPNERSSHTNPVVRGGGIIFSIALMIWYLYEGGEWPWLMTGVLMVAVISFVDDVTSLRPWVRMLFHVAAVLPMFYQIPLFDWPLWLIMMALIICIGTLNAFNFMDGINGITGIYALVSLLTFWYIDHYVVRFSMQSFIITGWVAVLVFLFFNFRKKAKCFAGDVGSITIAFVLIFLLLQLIHETGNFAWALLFLVFGVDSVVTIVYRLRKKENIFKPHRTHLYQFMSNELKMPHLIVSVIYGAIQLLVNVLVVNYVKTFDLFVIGFIVISFASYLIIRERTLKRLQRPGLFSDTREV